MLPRAISSVLRQDFADFQLVVVDDGSTDNTKEVLGAFADPRLCYSRLSENMGMFAARKRGLDLTKGDYVCFLDDDDELLPGALRTTVESLDRLSPMGVKMIWFDCVDAVTGRPYGSGLTQGFVSYEGFLCARGDFWGARDTRLGRERLLGIQSMLKLHREVKAYYFPKALYLVHKDHPSLSYDPRSWVRNKDSYVLRIREFLDDYGYDAERLCPEVYAKKLANLGLYLGLSGKKLEGFRAVLKSLKCVRSVWVVILLVLIIVLPVGSLEGLWLRYYYLRPSARRKRSQWSID